MKGKKMKVSIIAVMDEKRGIGKNNRIPWHIKEDLVRLKNLTRDHVVILGRKTYDSMVFYYNKSGNPMPGKLYLVVTRDKTYVPARDNAKAVFSIDEAITKAKEALRQAQGLQEVFIIGGQQVFEQTIGIADKLYLTIVEGNFGADTFFPDYSEFKKVVFEKESHSEKYKYRFLELERV